jgi:hypothetical protein
MGMREGDINEKLSGSSCVDQSHAIYLILELGRPKLNAQQK